MEVLIKEGRLHQKLQDRNGKKLPVNNPRIHLHGLVLAEAYRTSAEGAPVFHPAPALTNEKLQVLLDKIITRILRLLTREGHLFVRLTARQAADRLPFGQKGDLK